MDEMHKCVTDMRLRFVILQENDQTAVAFLETLLLLLGEIQCVPVSYIHAQSSNSPARTGIGACESDVALRWRIDA